MFKRVISVTLCSTVVLGLTLLSSLSFALDVNSVGATRTIECHRQRVEINGTDNNLTLLGECPAVEVNGTNQKVKIEIAGSIEVNGMRNRVIWGEALRGDRPHVEINGLNNSVKQGDVDSGRSIGKKAGGQKASVSGGDESADVSVSKRGGRQKVAVGGLNIESGAGGAAVTTVDKDTIVLNDNEATQTIKCQGNNVTVNGNECTLRLKGECATVLVNGNENTIRIDLAAKIVVTGNENSVIWEQGADSKAPVISDLGNENSVNKAK
ncbi:MAG: DUF3060 domain-containing protein [Vicinamibacteria bacterium]|nr:DUF3060 domain-containing protein [Vicinamibacteria bacterium]